MVKAVFYKRNNALSGFKITGHAGHGYEGNDIVCAAITSSTELVCNTITDFFHEKAEVSVGENEIILKLDGGSDAAQKLLEAFFDQIEYNAEQYGKIRLEIQPG